MYKNPGYNKIESKWINNNLFYNLADEDQRSNYFVSNYAVTNFGATTNRFSPSFLVIKSPSEHVVNGKYLDMEIQIYHDPVYERGSENENIDQDLDKSPIKGAVISLLFSVSKYTPGVSVAQNQTIFEFMKNLEMQFDHKERASY
jgi:hypothetical protein